ncbi:MAG: iron-containing alcohol dehydrogenase [Betaproteobacteria bacterium]|nr:iron-containing alcohol dehydrogenase [Betaproteobacteria bacterium]
MPIPAFSFARIPRIDFGQGTFETIAPILASFGTRVLCVTGHQSLRRTSYWPRLEAMWAEHALHVDTLSLAGEPSPQWVDEAVRTFRAQDIHAVLGIGGGSVLDAAKAIAGLLRPGNSIMDHLEGVGPEQPYRGPSTPFVAVPTTAGTGAEATRNAVLTVTGRHGFKKSFRDEQLVARHAIVDPDLLASCPPALIAANGMDALTQLIESYVSLRANPLSDALALSGLDAAKAGLLQWYETGEAAVDARTDMAYAALLSGITLAHVGLGAVHGLAAPLGAFHAVPHGVACGTVLAAATRINIEALRAREPGHRALRKYAQLGRLVGHPPSADDRQAQDALCETLEDWTRRLNLPRLSTFGIGTHDIAHIVGHSRGSSMKTNPLVLTDDELHAIVAQRL